MEASDCVRRATAPGTQRPATARDRVTFVDLPEELLDLIAAAGRDGAFCALRQTCRGLCSRSTRAATKRPTRLSPTLARPRYEEALFFALELMPPFADYYTRWPRSQTCRKSCSA